MIKNTPQGHPDYEDLVAAVDKLKEFTMNANESVRETEHSKKFIETLKDPKKYVGFDSIVAPHRSLIYECDICVKFGEKEYSWMLIFSDILVFASVSGKKRMVEEKISIEEVWFEDLGSIGLSLLFPLLLYISFIFSSILSLYSFSILLSFLSIYYSYSISYLPLDPSCSSI